MAIDSIKPSVAHGSRSSGKWPSFSAIALALLAAVLLDLPFPIAGPMPPWRATFAWIALIPLLVAILRSGFIAPAHYLRRSAVTGYAGGIAWYTLNSYWIERTMHLYGHVPVPGAIGILLLYSLVLGLYFGLFTFLLALVRSVTRSIYPALVLAPFAWAAVEIAASRITSVPWDQLGYSQVDNLLLTHLAPFTGVYGISFVLVAVNAVLAAAVLAKPLRVRLALAATGLIAAAVLQSGTWSRVPAAPTRATAVLLQPNFSVDEEHDWPGAKWDQNIARFLAQSSEALTPYYSGMPSPAKTLQPAPATPAPPISLIAWPEAPSPFEETDPRFLAAMHQLAAKTHAGIVVGLPAADWATDSQGRQYIQTFNSATIFSSAGDRIGRYDKIHLVPFGEYVPYSDLFFFAHKLTRQAGNFDRGTHRSVYTLNGHRYGVFICYESIFADEVRHFADNGAEVFVNISDDGWYGDTSAPWQHLNMARMRAIENRRWIVRDTNTGVTSVIDPEGRLLTSAPRGVFTSLAVQYGFRSDVTFYTRHGDLFGYACVIITLGVVLLLGKRRIRFQP
ncbi:apolipoprotein N-acyltransferase [Silvibacterium sp.]|uniref:apolipoprotein N-acyltransferase n=1 Tax=Silvibacterium sp. TaxID=1964179 RepID=UPI0039E37503